MQTVEVKRGMSSTRDDNESVGINKINKEYNKKVQFKDESNFAAPDSVK